MKISQLAVSCAALLAMSILAEAQTIVTVPAHTVTVPVPAQTINVPASTITYTEPAFTITVPGTPVTPPPAIVPWAISSSSVAPKSVAVGGSVILNVSITAGAAASGMLTDLEITDPSGNKVGQTNTAGENFAVGQTIPATAWTWVVPAGSTPGVYTFRVGMFTANYATNVFWNGSVGSFTVTAAGTGGNTPPPPPVVSTFGIKAVGNHFTDLNGNTVQIRGVDTAASQNCAGNGGPAPHMWDWSNLTTQSNTSPDWSKIKAWRVNEVRYMVSEQSWLGMTVTNPQGVTCNMDPNGDYKATVMKDVAALTSMGMYVDLSVHETAPGTLAPLEQEAMLNSDNSIKLWTSVAQTFKNNPAVLFELFNEPYYAQPCGSPCAAMFGSFTQNINYYVRNGGAPLTGSYTHDQNGSKFVQAYNWQTVGYQQVLAAVRATGATNVVIMGGAGYDNDETWWTSNPPQDPLMPPQIAMTYHAYPTTWGYEMTGTSNQFTAAQSQAMMTGPGYPVILTEMGGPVGPSANTTWNTNLLTLIDKLGWSVSAWVWNPWGGDNTLITDISSFTPTPGLGVTYHNWTLNHP